MAAYLSENPAVEWKFTWVFFPRAFRVVSIKSGKKKNKGRLFLVCGEGSCQAERGYGSVCACKGQYLLADISAVSTRHKTSQFPVLDKWQERV